MEKTRFYQIIDDLAAQWYIDTQEPVTSAVRKKDGTVVKGARLRERRESEIPNWTGWVNVVQWQERPQTCGQCGQAVPNPYQHIDLRKNTYRCDICGVRNRQINK